MYKPTEEDLEKCRLGHGCDFGICDECEIILGRYENDREVQGFGPSSIHSIDYDICD